MFWTKHLSAQYKKNILHYNKLLRYNEVKYIRREMLLKQKNKQFDSSKISRCIFVNMHTISLSILINNKYLSLCAIHNTIKAEIHVYIWLTQPN